MTLKTVRKTWVSEIVLHGNKYIDNRMHNNIKKLLQIRTGPFKDILGKKALKICQEVTQYNK